MKEVFFFLVKIVKKKIKLNKIKKNKNNNTFFGHRMFTFILPVWKPLKYKSIEQVSAVEFCLHFFVFHCAFNFTHFYKKLSSAPENRLLF